MSQSDDIKAAQALEPKAAAGAVSEEALGAPFDCWNQTGVEGDGTCRELRRFVHCRNCPVYSNAGLRLLNRELPPEYRGGWTEYFARRKDATAGGKTSVVIFRSGREWLALPTRVFQEVVEHRPVHSIPHRRDGVVLGLVNVRGELLLCVSLERLLGLAREVAADSPRFIYDRLLVVSGDVRRLVFPAEEVHGVHRFRSEELAAPPAAAVRPSLAITRAIFRWQDKVVGLLEPERLFSILNRSLS